MTSSGIDVEVNMKIPRVTIRAQGQADKIIDNSTVRFTTLIKVPAIPKQGTPLQLATRDGGGFESTVTRSDWSEEKSLFIVSCSYAKRSMSADEYNALCNQTIRTIVIRNWKDTNFLHTVFLRLNTGSVNLSPQELRQALLPGPFTDHIDDVSGQSKGLQELLGIDAPDPRMRDIEILARFLAFRFYAKEYPGRMKHFLDDTFGAFNAKWKKSEIPVLGAEDDFEAGIAELLRIFGSSIARKPGSSQFNRAIFDALIFFHSQGKIRKALKNKRKALLAAYNNLFTEGSAFLKAVESDTAGAPNTAARLSLWAECLTRVGGMTVEAPDIPQGKASKGSKASAPSKRKRS